MKYLIVINFIFFGFLNLKGQNNLKLPVNKYNDNYTFKQKTNKYFNSVHRFSVLLGYQRTNFLNPDFEINLDSAYNHIYGLNLTTRLEYYPLIIDLSGFYEDFGTNFNGIEGSLSWALDVLPKKSYIKFVPYVGGGYQHSFSRGVFNLSKPILKGGLMLNIGSANEFIINGEFKQAFPLSHEDTYTQYSLNLGLRGEALGKAGSIAGTIFLLLLAYAAAS